MTINEIEKKINAHILIYYNNNQGGEAIMNDTSVEVVADRLEKLGDYERVNIIINTNGGNSNSAYKLAELLKKFYKSYDVSVYSRCNSAGTLLALGARDLIITPRAFIGPCDPQLMIVTDEYKKNIPSSYIREVIAHHRKIKNLMGKLDPLEVEMYYTTIEHFKILCHNMYGHNRGKVIADYMLSRVSNHGFPLSPAVLQELGANVTEISDGEYFNFLKQIHEEMGETFGGYYVFKKTSYPNEEYHETLTAIRDKNGSSTLVKRYKIYNGEPKKIYEGYETI